MARAMTHPTITALVNVATTCLAAILLLAYASSVGFAIELIENGSFEQGAPPPGGGPIFAGWDDGPGIGNDLGFEDQEYPYILEGSIEGGDSGFELPPGALESTFTGTIAPAGAGRIYGNFWGLGNGSGFMGSATQIVDVSSNGSKGFAFSAWLASRVIADDPDYATVALQFFADSSSGSAPLGTIIFDGNDQGSEHIVGSLNLAGLADPSISATQDNWTLYRAVGTIPSTALHASVVVRGEVASGAGGNGSDAYVDLVSLQVVPEPSTLVLLGLLVPVFALGAMPRRRPTQG